MLIGPIMIIGFTNLPTLNLTMTYFAGNKNGMDITNNHVKFTLIPMTLNPHIRKLFVQNTSLQRLDATLQFYPSLEQLDLSRNQIKVGYFVLHAYIHVYSI